jgi:mxaJ protein
MSSRSRDLCRRLIVVLAAVVLGVLPAFAKTPELRVCADPNNLPFSNERGEGFENRIAQVLARELGATVRYTWWPQRRGFLRNTLAARACDVVLGLPQGYERVALTRPYYRSTYVFAWRRAEGPVVHSLDDPVLRSARVGVQLIGADASNTPPAHALARRGIIHNVRGYTVYGDYTDAAPAAGVLTALAEREIDVAVAWGPLAGWLAARMPVALELAPVTPAVDPPGLPFVFAMAAGVRGDDSALRERLDAALAARRAEIDAILDAYHVPRVETAP